MGTGLGEAPGLVVPGHGGPGAGRLCDLEAGSRTQEAGSQERWAGEVESLVRSLQEVGGRGTGARELGDIFGQDAVRGRGKGLLRAVHIWGWFSVPSYGKNSSELFWPTQYLMWTVLASHLFRSVVPLSCSLSPAS